MTQAPIQDLVYRPTMSPTSRVSDEGEKKEGSRNWDPWHIGHILGRNMPSMHVDEGHSLSGMLARSMSTWEVKMPPTKKHMVGGHLVPTVRGKVQFLAQRPRRISVEIHGPPQSHLDTPNESPIKHTMMQELLRGETPASDMEKEFLNDNEAVFFRILKEAKGSHRHGHGSGHDDSNDSSSGSSIQGGHAGTYTIIELSSGDSTRLRALNEISKQRY
jgi:hypothetical protein